MAAPTPPPNTTRERILQAAEPIILAKSFHSVGLNEILSAVKVPKGSFYHYFPSKEQFGAELLHHYVREHTARLRHFFAQPGLNAFERLLAWFDMATGKMMECGCQGGCLVAKLGSEVSSFSESMRRVLAAGMHEWRRIYEKVIREGQKEKSIRGDLDPALTAAFLQDAWQGAMHRMQIERNARPLRNAAQFFRQHLAPQ